MANLSDIIEKMREIFVSKEILEEKLKPLTDVKKMVDAIIWSIILAVIAAASSAIVFFWRSSK